MLGSAFFRIKLLLLLILSRGIPLGSFLGQGFGGTVSQASIIHSIAFHWLKSLFCIPLGSAFKLSSTPLHSFYQHNFQCSGSKLVKTACCFWAVLCGPFWGIPLPLSSPFELTWEDG
jgi:hypothetical protein